MDNFVTNSVINYKGPSSRSILSKVNTRTYELAKFLIPTLKYLTCLECTLKNSFAFAEETVEQDSGFFIGSLHIHSLFINIPFKESKKCWNTKRVEGLSKIEFKELLSLAKKESFFTFNGKFCKQFNGVTMGLPSGPTLANVFLVYLQKSWLHIWL